VNTAPGWKAVVDLRSDPRQVAILKILTEELRVLGDPSEANCLVCWEVEDRLLWKERANKLLDDSVGPTYPRACFVDGARKAAFLFGVSKETAPKWIANKRGDPGLVVVLEEAADSLRLIAVH